MSNPLQKYFRQPAIYIRLPSQGHFWPSESIDLPPNGELAVFPMTARDELIYKTPDALMNGQSTVDVIQSCIPQIKDAWQCPAVDLDTLLIAIRIASYGNQSEMTIKCPKCSEVGDYTHDLGHVLSVIKTPNYGTPVKVQGLEVYLKPQNYKSLTDFSLKTYQEQKLLQMINDSNLSNDEKVAKFTEMFRTITDLTIDGMTRNIHAIKTDEDLVTDPDFIKEFAANCSKTIWSKIEKRLQEIGKEAAIPDIEIKCDSCGHEFQSPFVLDPTNFFG